MKALKLIAACLSFGIIAGGCYTQINPVGNVPTGPGAATTNFGVREQSSAMIYSPTMLSVTATLYGGPVMTSFGGASTGVLSWASPGVGGALGNFSSDYYIRYSGHKGPDASLDYNSMSMFFAGSTTNFPIKAYKGVTFYARGTGNFGVAISGPGLATGQTGPYKSYNYYEKVFGSELSPKEWHQVTVIFTEMTQLYGQAADLGEVLKGAWGLQFNQEVPITADFQLDIDFVRFIPTDIVSGYGQ